MKHHHSVESWKGSDKETNTATNVVTFKSFKFIIIHPVIEKNTSSSQNSNVRIQGRYRLQ